MLKKHTRFQDPSNHTYDLRDKLFNSITIQYLKKTTELKQTNQNNRDTQSAYI